MKKMKKVVRLAGVEVGEQIAVHIPATRYRKVGKNLFNDGTKEVDGQKLAKRHGFSSVRQMEASGVINVVLP